MQATSRVIKECDSYRNNIENLHPNPNPAHTCTSPTSPLSLSVLQQSNFCGVSLTCNKHCGSDRTNIKKQCYRATHMLSNTQRLSKTSRHSSELSLWLVFSHNDITLALYDSTSCDSTRRFEPTLTLNILSLYHPRQLSTALSHPNRPDAHLGRLT